MLVNRFERLTNKRYKYEGPFDKIKICILPVGNGGEGFVYACRTREEVLSSDRPLGYRRELLIEGRRVLSGEGESCTNTGGVEGQE